MTPTTPIEHVSDTAYWMASYRAMESERKDALFHDPLAKVLIGERGKVISDSMKSNARYSSWSLVIRTVVIDQFLMQYTKAGYKTVINLGAGLDTRPYRLDLPEDVHWIEIDFPDVIQMKNEKLKDEKPKCRLERIGLDLSDREARQKLFSELNARVSPAIILTEGVVPYLTEQMVTELGLDLKAQQNFQLWIAEYTARELYHRLQAQSFSKLLANAPFQFFPQDWFGVFQNAGWFKKDMRYLYDEGERVGRRFPIVWWVKLLRPLFGSEKLAERLRLQGYVVFAKTQ